MASAADESSTLLVVDDDSMVRSWVRLALEGTEFRVAGEASSAAEAADLAVRRRPSLMLIDYLIGRDVGTELLRDLRRRGVTARAVLMTANESTGFNEDAREAGAQGSVLKTGSVDHLLTSLRAVV